MVALGCMAAAWADFTEGDIALLRQETRQKIGDLRTYLTEVEDPQDRLALVNMALGYVGLYDLTGASNAAEVLKMPYVRVLIDSFMRISLSSGTRRSLVQQYLEKGEMDPSFHMQELLGGAHTKEDWDPPFVSAIEPNVDREEFQRCYETMGILRELYLEAKLNPDQVSLPLDVADPFAYPIGIPLYEDEDQQIPNKAFFVRWFLNIYSMLVGEWDEGIRELDEDIPVFF